MLYINEVVPNETNVVIRPEYFNMARDFWLYSDKWRGQDTAKGGSLVLGGEYTIWKVVGQAIYLQDKYCSYDIPNAVGANDLVLASNFKTCSFKIGDIIKPKRLFDFDSFKSELGTYYEKYFSKDRHNEHRVVGILNDRYVFIDYEPLSDYSLPFACDDFESGGLLC